MNTSTPKKPSDVKMAMNEARSSFFGLDDTNYDNVPPVSPIRGQPQPRRDSQMDTADMLEDCTEGDSGGVRMGTSDGSEENYRTCDINNNNDQQQKRNSNKESESGLGSISAASDEPDAKQCPEKALLLDDPDADEDEGIHTHNNNNNGKPRNIIREPQYYSNKPNPTQVSKA